MIVNKIKNHNSSCGLWRKLAIISNKGLDKCVFINLNKYISRLIRYVTIYLTNLIKTHNSH